MSQASQDRTLPRLFVVLPCFNEEEVLPETSSRLKSAVKDLAERSLISGESRKRRKLGGPVDHRHLRVILGNRMGQVDDVVVLMRDFHYAL